MKRLFVILVLLLSPSLLAGGAAYRDQEIIDRAKALDVSRLDSSLPSRALDEWLRLGPPHLSTVRWRTSNCDSKREAEALCVRFTFTRGDVSGFGLIRVGTAGEGSTGAPRFEHAVVATPEMSRAGRHETVLTLSQLAAAIAKYSDSR